MRDAILELTSHVENVRKMVLDAMNLLLGLWLTFYENIGGQLWALSPWSQLTPYIFVVGQS